jgi:hypothetical protein
LDFVPLRNEVADILVPLLAPAGESRHTGARDSVTSSLPLEVDFSTLWLPTSGIPEQPDNSEQGLRRMGSERWERGETAGPSFGVVSGVDFSGAKLAGRNTWVARLEVWRRRRAGRVGRLTHLASLEKLCGTAARAKALAHLVEMIAASQDALWALDCPFGFPVEVMAPGGRWADQFDFLAAWGEDAYEAGLECLRRAQARGGPKHIRRLTDAEARAPFDAYHYRII